MGPVYFSIMLTDRERTATKDVCVVPKTPDSKMVLLVRRTRPERERILCSLCQNESLFSFTHVSSHFPVTDLWEFSANLISFFFFFFLFSFNFYLFIYSFPTNSWKIEVIFSVIIRVRLFSEKNDLLKIFFLIIVIFLDNKYIKTLLNSNKILSENFKPISGIKLEIIG